MYYTFKCFSPQYKTLIADLIICTLQCSLRATIYFTMLYLPHANIYSGSSGLEEIA